MEIDFYTGPQCSLCDDAMLLVQALDKPDLIVNKCNIRENTDWYHLYAVRIPVLKRKDTGLELGWPFNLDDLRQFLS